jgi:hypothetical protein
MKAPRTRQIDAIQIVFPFNVNHLVAGRLEEVPATAKKV